VTTDASAGRTDGANRSGSVGDALRRALPWLPAALLLGMAGVHAVLVTQYQLSPWLGGGFGMFSTTDSATSRHVHAYAVAADGVRTEIDLPEDLDEAMRSARVLPTPSAVQGFARLVARWSGAARVDVEVWQTTYDPASMAPSSRVLRTAVAENRAGAPR
jgi:hypothetical protein